MQPKIIEVNVFTKSLPIVGGYRMATTELDRVEATVVQIISENGDCGWGETCPLGSNYQEQHHLGALAAIEHLAPSLIGLKADQPKLLMRRCDQLLMGHNYAKSAIDIAAMDLAARLAKVRLCDYLGGALVDRVPSYYALGIDSPAATAELARTKSEQGYRRLQIKVGGRSIAEDIATIRAVYESVGSSVQLVADGNRSLTTSDTLQLSNGCREIPITLEQPCNSIGELHAIKSQLSHPIYLDENIVDLVTLIELAGTSSVDGFGLKIGRLGGVNAMGLARDLCKAKSLPHTVDDCWGGDIVAAACAHVAATVEPRLLQGVWIAQPYIANHYDSNNGIKVDDGFISIPSGPGLGITPDNGCFRDPVLSISIN